MNITKIKRLVKLSLQLLIERKCLRYNTRLQRKHNLSNKSESCFLALKKDELKIGNDCHLH